MKIFHFAVPIFDYQIALVYGELPRFRSWLARNKIADADGEYDGLTIHPPATSAILVFLKSDLEEKRKHAIIYHESLHAANYIFNDLSIKQDTDSDEGTAMMQTYIADKIISRTGKKHDDNGEARRKNQENGS